MIYKDLEFPQKQNRPFFYTNFVSTVDGKVQVLDSDQAKYEQSSNPADYWPIGSETDFQTLLDLRAYSDVFIHGKNTALGFNHLARINSSEFKEKRKLLGKTADLAYVIVVSSGGEELVPFLKNDFGSKAFIT